MAGILANSTSKTMVSSSAYATSTGYITGERIVLTATPPGTDYLWASGAPSSSSVARSELSAETGSSVYFVPDVAGYYVVTCNVDGTDYVIRLSVVSASLSLALAEGVRLSPVIDAQVPTPAAGVCLYYSSTQSALAIKDSDGDVFTVDLTAA